MTSLQAPAKQVIHPKIDDRKRFLSKSTHCRKKKTLKKRKEKKKRPAYLNTKVATPGTALVQLKPSSMNLTHGHKGNLHTGTH